MGQAPRGNCGIQKGSRLYDAPSNGRTKTPLDEWKRELAELTTQREVLLAGSDKLTAELWSAEVIKRNAEKVMGANAPRRNRSQDMDL